MFLLGATRFYRNRHYGIADQLARPFIETDNRAFWIIRLFIKFKNILHAPDEIACYLPNTPAGL